MNENQLKQIILFKNESKAPELIPEQLEELKIYDSCHYFLQHECKDCNACEILEVLNDPDAVLI